MKAHINEIIKAGTMRRTKDERRLALAVHIVNVYQHLPKPYKTKRLRAQAKTDTGVILYSLVSYQSAEQLGLKWEGYAARAKERPAATPAQVDEMLLTS